MPSSLTRAVAVALVALPPLVVMAGPGGARDAPGVRLAVPTDNEMTEARVALGRRLFFETALSRDGKVSCASCHDPERGFADARPVAVGVAGRTGQRNTPTVMNAALLPSQFWDGRAPTLEAQAAGPILNPVEMGMPSPAAALAALAPRGYGPQFQAAYGRAMSFADVGRALAAFERTLVFLRAPFDRFAAGETDALSPEAREGWRLFRGRGRCVVCHDLRVEARLGSDHRFRNIGISARQPDWGALAAEAQAAAQDPAALARLGRTKNLAPLGRFVVTRDPAELGAFRSAPLRNVALTAPYMHDGSLATLWDTLDYYNNGGTPHAQLDKDLLPLDLTAAEIDQLVAFLFSLTDERFTAQNTTELQRQRTLATTRRPIRDEVGALLRVPRPDRHGISATR